MEWLKSLLEENQFLQGGAVLAAVGAAAVYLRSLPAIALRFIRRQFVVTLEVNDNEGLFSWVQAWLADQPISKTARNVMPIAEGGMPTALAVERRSMEDPDRPKWALVPAPGSYLIRWKGRRLLVRTTREEANQNGVSIGWRRTISVSYIGRARRLANEIINAGYEACQTKRERTIQVWSSQGMGWQMTGRRMLRPLDSVILADRSLPEDLVEHVRRFEESRDWYAQHGVPWKLTFLLSGAPGNGKTSLIMAIASALRKDVHFLHLADLASDASAANLLSESGGDGIVVIEDIDAASSTVARRDPRLLAASDSQSGPIPDEVSLSGLLNAMDGILTPEGRIAFITTNHPDKLDPALMRPGRVDRHIEIGNATPSMARRLFMRFYGEAKLTDDIAAALSQLTKSSEVSMSALQTRFMEHRDRPSVAVGTLVAERAEKEAAA